MTLLTEFNLNITADAVLRGQGADPQAVRARRPRLAEIAEEALQESRHLLQPQAISSTYRIETVQHNRILLQGGALLRGETISRHLVSAQEVAVVLCTIGPELEEYLEDVMAIDMVRGLALYGVGSAAVEAVANAVCQEVDQMAAARNWQTTVPLSPGMIGWDVSVGQPLIFSLLNTDEIGVRLTEQNVMVPLKSLSMVIGLGPDLRQAGSTCDYCAMAEVCRYKNLPLVGG